MMCRKTKNDQDRIIVLDKLRFKLAVTIGKAIAQMTDIDIREATAELLAVAIKTTVLAEKIIDCDLQVDFPFPATWWEHLKLSILSKLPDRWRKKIDVKLKHYYHIIRVQQYVGYPEANEVLEDRWGKPVTFDMWESIPGEVLFGESPKVIVEEVAKWHPGEMIK
jgi:hypothetical protein